jgi:hypothetical protein
MLKEILLTKSQYWWKKQKKNLKIQFCDSKQEIV